MFTRRQVITLISGLIGGCSNTILKSTKSAHVVIIGGGFGGATAAKYIKLLNAKIKVTLIEPKPYYTSCPGSNWVFAGLQNFQALHFQYSELVNQYAVTLVQQAVINIEPEKKRVILDSRDCITYDRLIVSPGIDFDWGQITGHGADTINLIPHAWQAGQQTRQLNQQLIDMPDGGTIIICAPANPYRCPPGPYERASMMACYLKQHKPQSKIIILDAKNQFSKQALFIAGWQQYYGYDTNQSLIEWLPMTDNPIIHIDSQQKTIETDFGDQFKADVINYIPPQKAGYIAQITGLTDHSGWCPVHYKTAESSIQPNIHVIGDAAYYHPLPKSAFAANAEAKVCAFAVINLLAGQDPVEPSWINTCYSLVNKQHGISIAMVYKLDHQGHLVKSRQAGGVSPQHNRLFAQREALYTHYWFQTITKDSFQ